MLLIWSAFGDQWALNHPVTFDGNARRIYISPNISTINVRADIYSNWKEWTQLYDNSKFPAAFRATGGDPTISGEYSGDIYFLINNWQLVISHTCQISGVIYSDNFPSPFIQTAGTQIVTNKVSSLVTAVNVGGASTGMTLAEMESSTVIAKKADIDTLSSSITTRFNAVDAAIGQIETAGLTPTQATMLLEMYNLLGLDPTIPLIVTETSRIAGGIVQSINSSTTETVVIRE